MRGFPEIGWLWRCEFAISDPALICRHFADQPRGKDAIMNIHTEKLASHAAASRGDAACRAAMTGRDAGDMLIRFTSGPCSLGQVLVATSGKGICAILLGDDSAALLDELSGRFPHAVIRAGGTQLEHLLAEVTSFVESPASGLHWPLDIRGTAFQRRVWRALEGIPPGSTLSYAELARRIGSPQAARAVARACAGNRIAVAIPCHRLVRSDGAPSGYRWGASRKQALLAREAMR
jgi:AraC family transcriptional regulator of adaptative response/methylated-DNA-[protein]-cysteine methyltransferase